MSVKWGNHDEECERLVEQAYQALLLRPVDPAGRADWTGRLARSEANFGDLLRFLLSSGEFASQLQRFADAYGAGDRAPFFNEHSQNGEVSLLLAGMINTYAKHRIVVDVGAHGKSGSNSWDLLRHFGWRGILIEPNPALVERIREEFAGLDCHILPVAISDFTGTTSLHLGVHSEISSLRREATASWGAITGTVEVPVERLSDILRRYDVPVDFDLLSTDAEGEDLVILSDLTEHGFRPGWIIVEVYKGLEVESLASQPLPPAIIAEYEIAGRTFPNLILRRIAA